MGIELVKLYSLPREIGAAEPRGTDERGD
jgi:hypothetical protein